MCSQLVDPSKLTQLTWLGRFLGVNGLNWVVNFFIFYFLAMGWVRFGLGDSQIHLIQLEPSTFNIYFKIYIISFS